MAPKRVRLRGSLETGVLACLASADRPMTPAEVLAEVDGSLAYTTVMTTLTRLHHKRAVERTPRGRAYAYFLAGGAETARSNITAHQMHKLLDDGNDRASVLTRFVADLSPEDERLLAKLLNPPDDSA